MLVRPLTWQAAKQMADEILSMSPEMIGKAKAAMEIKSGN